MIPKTGWYIPAVPSQTVGRPSCPDTLRQTIGSGSLTQCPTEGCRFVGYRSCSVERTRLELYHLPDSTIRSAAINPSGSRSVPIRLFAVAWSGQFAGYLPGLCILRRVPPSERRHHMMVRGGTARLVMERLDHGAFRADCALYPGARILFLLATLGPFQSGELPPPASRSRSFFSKTCLNGSACRFTCFLVGWACSQGFCWADDMDSGLSRRCSWVELPTP